MKISREEFIDKALPSAFLDSDKLFKKKDSIEATNLSDQMIHNKYKPVVLKQPWVDRGGGRGRGDAGRGGRGEGGRGGGGRGRGGAGGGGRGGRGNYVAEDPPASMCFDFVLHHLKLRDKPCDRLNCTFGHSVIPNANNKKEVLAAMALIRGKFKSKVVKAINDL